MGSRARQVYIVHCDFDSNDLQLRTTIRVGVCPVQVQVDVDNRCFYALDVATAGAGDDERERDGKENAGRNDERNSDGGARTDGPQLRTLAPTEFGNVKERLSLPTGASSAPTGLFAAGLFLYVAHADAYAVFRRPRPPRSTRRRRSSVLVPIREDAVAESLAELYAASARNQAAGVMPEHAVASSLRDVRQALLHSVEGATDDDASNGTPSEGSAAVVEMDIVQRTAVKQIDQDLGPMVKVVPLDDETHVVVAWQRAVTICSVDQVLGTLQRVTHWSPAASDGQDKQARDEAEGEQVIDCDCRGSAVYVLTNRRLVHLVVDGAFRMTTANSTIVDDGPRLVRVTAASRAYVQTAGGLQVLDVGLASPTPPEDSEGSVKQSSRVIDVQADSFVLQGSPSATASAKVLLSNTKNDTLELWDTAAADGAGERLASIHLDRPVVVTRMT